MEIEVYRQLAEKLDRLPNGFPPTPDGIELRLLAKLFTPQEAVLAAHLGLTPQTPEQVKARLGEKEGKDLDVHEVGQMLKSMARKGLIAASKIESGLAFRLMPFVVGIYESQVSTMDAELAALFEAYYRQAFVETVTIQPTYHRVVPIEASLSPGIEVQPYESASAILNQAQAWGVLDCICRKQKALIGEPCEHPIDVCMALGPRPGIFDNHPVIHALTLEEAQATLRRAAEVGLVHSVSNSKEGITYICNCCTCSCGILRGMKELGIANVIASSSFVNQVDPARCTGCQDCLEYCQFNALELVDGLMSVNARRCVGCGVCVLHCIEGALQLVPRPAEEVLPIPANTIAWMQERAKARGISLEELL